MSCLQNHFRFSSVLESEIVSFYRILLHLHVSAQWFFYAVQPPIFVVFSWITCFSHAIFRFLRNMQSDTFFEWGPALVLVLAHFRGLNPFKPRWVLSLADKKAGIICRVIFEHCSVANEEYSSSIFMLFVDLTTERIGEPGARSDKCFLSVFMLLLARFLGG